MEGNKVTLLSRNAKDRTSHFGAVAVAVGALPHETLLLDGEAVAFDSLGVSRFQLLQNLTAKLHYAVFDCLYVDGRDLAGRAASSTPRSVGKNPGKTDRQKRFALFASARLAADGLKAYEIAKRKGFEGVVAKDESSPLYRWPVLKVAQVQSETRRRICHRRLHCARRRPRTFRSASAGGQPRWRDDVCRQSRHWILQKQHWRNSSRKFQPLVRSNPQVADPPRERDVTWLAPRLVAQIAYGEWTDDRKLRQPVFLGLRDDKSAAEVTLPEAQ